METGAEAKLTLSNVPLVISADFLVRGLSLKVTAVETESEQNGLAEMGPGWAGHPSGPAGHPGCTVLVVQCRGGSTGFD